MYPLTLIKLSLKKSLVIETKDGIKIAGTVVECDSCMNLKLQNVSFCIDQKTEKSSLCYLKGSTIKYVKVKPGVLQKQYLFE